MKVLVTGGAGYVGSVLTRRLLAEGHFVRVVDRLMHETDSLAGLYAEDGFEFQAGDLRQSSVIARAVDGMDAVVHLAAIVGDPACAKEKELALETNHTASLHLYDAAARAGVQRFVFASTCSNYGRMPDGNTFVDEITALNPISLYAESKVAVERFLLELQPQSPMTITVLRLSTVYGLSPRMRFDLTVNEFTRDLLLNGSITVFGEQFWRPYIHVRDVARAVQTVLESSPEQVRGEVFNVGDNNENFTKAMLVEKIRAAVGRPTSIERVHRDEDPRDYRVDFTRIARQLNFRITRTVDAGIAELINAIGQGVFADPFAARYRN